MEGPGPQELALQATLDRKRSALETVAHHPGVEEWVKPAAATEQGTQKLLELLEQRIGQPGYAGTLEAEQQRAAAPPAGPDDAAAAGAAAAPPHGSEVLQADWWELTSDGTMHTVSEATGDYVFVEREDVVDALSSFIAAYVASLPDTRGMDPRQLQQAIAIAFQEMRKGRVRRLLDWSKLLYRTAAVTYGAFSVFTNPAIAQAVLAALWTGLRVLGRLVF